MDRNADPETILTIHESGCGISGIITSIPTPLPTPISLCLLAEMRNNDYEELQKQIAALTRRVYELATSGGYTKGSRPFRRNRNPQQDQLPKVKLRRRKHKRYKRQSQRIRGVAPCRSWGVMLPWGRIPSVSASLAAIFPGRTVANQNHVVSTRRRRVCSKSGFALRCRHVV